MALSVAHRDLNLVGQLVHDQRQQARPQAGRVAGRDRRLHAVGGREQAQLRELPFLDRVEDGVEVVLLVQRQQRELVGALAGQLLGGHRRDQGADQQGQHQVRRHDLASYWQIAPEGP